ncbi:MAG: hypothetical protein WC959_08305 [Kiritimatiellales bacterium]
MITIIPAIDLKGGYWLVAGDVMQPVEEKATPKMKLADVLDDMSRMQLEAIPVTRGDGTPLHL